MELVILFFIVVSILEAIAKAKKGPAPGPFPDTGEELPGPPRERSRPRGAPSSEGATSSEGMVPTDLWAEIEALARGEMPGRPPAEEPPEVRAGRARRADEDPPAPSSPRAPQRRKPRKPPPTRTRPRRADLPVPTSRPLPVPTSGTGTAPAPSPPAPREEHPIHQFHADYHTDPSERAPAVVGEVRTTPTRADHLRQGLGSGPDALRRAVILREVLGRPAAYRGDPLEGME